MYFLQKIHVAIPQKFEHIFYMLKTQQVLQAHCITPSVETHKRPHFSLARSFYLPGKGLLSATVMSEDKHYKLEARAFIQNSLQTEHESVLARQMLAV